MNTCLVLAAAVAILVGRVHSALGKVLMFRQLRSAGIVPKSSAPPLQSRNIRILWATWHLASVFGFASAAILLSLADGKSMVRPQIAEILIVAFSLGSGLVLLATRGKRPGWIGLLAVAVLTCLGNPA